LWSQASNTTDPDAKEAGLAARKLSDFRPDPRDHPLLGAICDTTVETVEKTPPSKDTEPISKF